MLVFSQLQVSFHQSYNLNDAICPQTNSFNTRPCSCHFDSTVHAAACLHTDIATHQVLELRSHRNSNKIRKKMMSSKSVVIASICAGMAFNGNFPLKFISKTLTIVANEAIFRQMNYFNIMVNIEEKIYDRKKMK